MRSGILAIAFDLDDTLYYDSIGIPNIARKSFAKIGLQNALQMTDAELMQIIQEGAETWLKDYMLSNNVAYNWQPSATIWIQYCSNLIDSIEPISTSELAGRLKDEWEKYGPPGRGSFKPDIINGCYEMLWELDARGYKLGLCTNRIYDPSPVLERDSILDVFDNIEHSGVPGYIKPSCYMLFRFADCVRINPHRCAYVGDRLDTDIEAALKAGMLPVLAKWKRTKNDFVADDILIANNPEEILSFFP